MAVHTKITFDELKNHLKSYEIGDLLDFKEIVEGIDNSNFIVLTSKNKFIFTIFESRIDKDSLPYFINFKEHLFSKNILCPQPIKNKDGLNIVNFRDKKTAIVSFLEGSSLKVRDDGYYDNISIDNCAKVGEYLAKMHLASQDFLLKKGNDLNIDGIEILFNKFKPLLNDYDPSLLKLLSEAIAFIRTNWQPSLPSAPCHLDLFPDNVFFKNNAISAVIDFYFSANELLIYDLAIIVNAWTFDINEFNFSKFNALLSSYEKVRPLLKEERIFMRVALICAATRFLTTRLNDYFFTPKDSLVKIKNPDEYKEKLIFFLNNAIALA